MAYERAGLSHEQAAVWARRKLDKGLGEGYMNQERNMVWTMIELV